MSLPIGPDDARVLFALKEADVQFKEQLSVDEELHNAFVDRMQRTITTAMAESSLKIVKDALMNRARFAILQKQRMPKYYRLLENAREEELTEHQVNFELLLVEHFLEPFNDDFEEDVSLATISGNAR